MLTIVGALQAWGRQHILVPGMPDLGLTPEYYGDPSATAFSYAFDQALQANLPKGATYFDTFGFMHAVVANPGAFGFTDVTDPCLVGVTPCSNPEPVSLLGRPASDDCCRPDPGGAVRQRSSRAFDAS